MNLKSLIMYGLGLALLIGCSPNDSGIKIDATTVSDGEYTARVISPTEMISDYPMDRNYNIPQPIIFKLSINGDDNEAGFGKDHHLVIPQEVSEFFAPTLKFGVHYTLMASDVSPITRVTNVHFRVDMRDVLDSFASNNFYVTPTNDTIPATDFKGLFIAGGTAPLEWIWDSPDPTEKLKFQDTDQDSIYELTLQFAPPSPEVESRSWKLTQDLSSLPNFLSPEAPILEALTNMALEESMLDIREDGAFSAGKEWQGVWTRDISYAAQLSLAYLFPENVKTSLRAKLSPAGRIIQDTGTGGSWPVSSDRHVWTLAAWEVFLATGDQEWLNEIKKPVLDALQEDILWNRDPVSGMLLGETSFEDWREQTYPEWMTPANIHASHALSTNIVFKRALEIGLALATGNPNISRSWPALIQRLDQNIINHFWNPELNGPASYVMANPTWNLAPHRDILGESLGILFSKTFAPQAFDLVGSYPRTDYGSPVISHQLPHSPPYHNQAIWPFVETYSILAAKQAGQQEVYRHGFNGLIRAAGLFLSHRENFHYINGRPDLTQINSDRQLWSVAGWLGAIYKGLFGITINYDFDRKGFDLDLKPNNPFKWDNFTLTNLTLHNTPISIHLKGSGSAIKSIKVNGEDHPEGASMPLLGETLDVTVVLEELEAPRKTPLLIADYHTPDMPDIMWSNDTLAWYAPSSIGILELNGRVLDTLELSPVLISDSLNGFFTLRTLDSTGASSLPTKPHYLGPSATLMLSSEAPYYIELGKDNAFINLSFNVPSDGNYLMRFIYANGSGPLNTGNTCGLAKLSINDWWLEQMVSFPHTNAWENLATTSWMKALFKSGKNTLNLDQESLPVTNMNGETNLFRVFSVEIVPLQN